MIIKLIIFLNFSVNIIRSLLFPLIVLPASFFSKKAKKRLLFEQLNLFSLESSSFKNYNKVADIAFEVSSEGELEQIRPVLESCLNENMLVELIFSSDSVENKCKILADSNKENLRIFRMPLISHFCFNALGGQSLSKWITAKTLVLCRYDFFPELILWGSKSDVSMILASASLKSKQGVIDRNGIGKAYIRNFYRLFDYIFAASLEDEKRLLSIDIEKDKIKTFDFRIVQIDNRVKKNFNILRSKGHYNSFKSLFDKFDRKNRFILGSAWPIEMGIFRSEDFLNEIINGKIIVTIAPHKLNNDYIKELKQNISKILDEYQLDMPIYTINKNMSSDDITEIINDFIVRSGVIINTIPGILCESYPLYGNAFVGGGHGRSIHSVLEPYLSGCRVFCGPKVFRSTEFDIIKSFSKDFVHIVDKLETFYDIFKNVNDGQIDLDVRSKLVDHNHNDFKKIIENFKQSRFVR